MVQLDKSWPRASEADEALTAAVESGDCDRVRALAKQAFYGDEKFAPSWDHLKIALVRDDKPMTRLLITWGARAPESVEQLNGLLPEKLADYARALRRFGLEARVFEEGAKILPLLQTPREPGIGNKMPDGTVYAGLTADGNQKIYAMPADLDMTMTFNDAAQAVKKLNDKKSLGHDDWQIPGVETLHVLHQSRDRGALKETFAKGVGNISTFPDLYWSSTECHGNPGNMWSIRFPDGQQTWGHVDRHSFSCRPVRLEKIRGEPEIGDKMPDGTYYVGISPDTKQPMYAAPSDAPLKLSFSKAAKYARDLEVGGKKGFRVPSMTELDVVRNAFLKNEEMKKTFDLTDSYPDGWYWSSASNFGTTAWCQRLHDGWQHDSDCRWFRLSVRPVRG